MSKINEVIEVLSDGYWHRIETLTVETKLDKISLLRVLDFFHEYGFIEISSGGEAARLPRGLMK